MALYTAQTNSPSTTLASAAMASATSITLANGDVFSDLTLPNLLTLGYTQANSETVLVTAISGNVATVERGVDGTATDWPVDTPVARVFTAKDWNDMITEKADASAIPSASTSTPVVDGTGSAGSSAAYARGDHVHPTDTSRAPTSHASSATTYGKGTSTNYGHVKLSDSVSSTTAAASGGTAATPYAVKSVADAKQDKITATGVLVGDGSGGVSAVTISTNLTLDNGTLSSAGLTAHDATLTTTWTTSSSYKVQTVTVSGLKSSYNVPPIVDVVLSGSDATADKNLLDAWALVSMVTTGTDSVTAKCVGDAPTVAIPIKILVWE